MAFMAYVALNFGGRRAAFLSVSAFSKGAPTSTSNFRRPLPSLFRRSIATSTPWSLSSATVPAAEGLKTDAVVDHPSYECVSVDTVSEYGAKCVLYKHRRSGAELLSVEVADDNRVFGITFRTPPSDSTGVPHILEHSVLCGSRKFTTKDPFVQLLQSSLQTFLNAFTYPDRTCYVVASRNLEDFYNLVDVYADAVYHPRAISDPTVHAQEGWHLELDKPEDELTYKGVVYNEMKGVYSSPDSILYRQAQRSLHDSGHTYAVDSGGDPRHIPDLSFQQFADFHAKFYHPANSRIFFSGDDDVRRRLDTMDSYLSEFGPSPESRPASTVTWQPRNFAAPKREVVPYPVSADDASQGDSGKKGQHMVMVNWLLHDEPLTATEELTLNLLDHLLMGTPQSVLYRAMMESGLGSALVGGGLSDELRQATFSVGLKGVLPDKVEEIETLVVDTLQKCREEGFSEEAVAASMNTIEFQLREFNTGSFPRGLSFMLAGMSQWIYDGSPTEGLKFEAPLAELKATIAESGSKVFQDMIEELLLKNNHRSTVEMVPSPTLEGETLSEERERLAKIKAEMSPEDLERVVEETRRLKELQASEDSPEDRATIPRLQLEDLTRECEEIPIEVESKDGKDHDVDIVVHSLPSTSGILYADYGLDISGVPMEDVPLLGIFCRLLTETGITAEANDGKALSPVDLSRLVGSTTGGIAASTNLLGVRPDGTPEGVVNDGSHMITKLFLRGKATSDRASDLFGLYKKILVGADIANSRSKVRELVRENLARMESNIQGSGHSYAQVRIKSRLSAAGYLSEQCGGISFLDTLKSLQGMVDDDEKWPELLGRLEGVRAILVRNARADGAVLNLTGDADVLAAVRPAVDGFLDDLPSSDASPLPNFYTEVHPWIEEARKQMGTPSLKDEGFVVPTQVNYVGKGGLLYRPGEKVSGSAAVVSKFLSTGYLWDRVRVMGGAYGGFCGFSAGDGYFGFLSYRDPNLADTLDVYDGAAAHLREAATLLTEDKEALTAAVVGAVGDMDAVLSPDQKGWLSLQRHLKRESAEHRQAVRDSVLGCTADDFSEFADRLAAMLEAEDTSVAVVSSVAGFEAAKEAGKDMEVVDVL